MVAQLHLALVMAIDAKLLVLDEPTLGLDILYRKQFYDSLLNDYFDGKRTIVVTTHQVEELQNVLTDVVFINRGRIVLNCSMEEFEARFLEVTVNPDKSQAGRALNPDSRAPGIRSQHSFCSIASIATNSPRLAKCAHPPSLTVRCSGWEHDRLSGCTGAEQLPGSGPMNPPMNTSSNAMPESGLDSRVVASTHIPATRLLYWSIRRELWEYRSIYVAPLAAAAIFLFGFLITLPLHMRGVKTLDQAHKVLEIPTINAVPMIRPPLIRRGFSKHLVAPGSRVFTPRM